MAKAQEPVRIVGPLKTWYDLHEALGHEIGVLTDLAAQLTLDSLDAFAERFAYFDLELRNHSEVEDGIMFPAVAERGGAVDPRLGAEHREEQRRTYDLSCALLHAKTARTPEALAALAGATAALRDSLRHHLALEEDDVLGQVDRLFSADEQARLLGAIFSALPADPRLQPWVAAALTPEHLEARLRNMAASLPHSALVAVLAQIRDGVDAATWAEVQSRTPDLAALATPGTDGG